MIVERVFGHPGVPMGAEERRRRFQGVIRLVFSDEELALKRLAGRRFQAQLHAGRQYEAEAIATAQPVNPEYEQ